ncbi:MAG TPA: hypothetical protein VKZ18_02780 [Polyangia bacterium]|nr:hypothetical protein [Polyangia bacterium]
MRFTVEWTAEAWAEARALAVPERGWVMRAAAALARAAWAAKVSARRRPTFRVVRAAGHRLIYGFAGAGGRSIWVLRVIAAGAAPRRSSVARAEARELIRRGEALRRLGGGIPHAVVRRHWLSELGRELAALARDYDGSARAARRLLETVLVAERERLAGVAGLRRRLAVRIGRPADRGGD